MDIKVFPFKDISKCRITLPFGIKGTRWKAGFHPGVDIVSDGDKTIISPIEGTVTRSKLSVGGWGQFVGIKEANSTKIHIFGHMVEGSQKVSVGSKVKVGASIGTMGKTGNVDGAHLHYEIQNDYYSETDVSDPTEFLGIENVKTYKVGEIKYLEEEEEVNLLDKKIELPSGKVITVKAIEHDGKMYTEIRDVVKGMGYEVDWTKELTKIVGVK